MASSAVYRYFENRDVLLTALIVDAYDALGEAVEQAEAVVPRDDLAGRWVAIAHAVRAWALAHPPLYALVYGSPVPGYAAPQDTVGPATRVTRLLAALLRDSVGSGAPSASSTASAPAQAGESAGGPAPEVAEGLAPLVAFLGVPGTDDAALRGLVAWTWLFGAVSFELFGQLEGAVAPERREEVFGAQAAAVAAWLGLAPRL